MPVASPPPTGEVTAATTAPPPAPSSTSSSAPSELSPLIVPLGSALYSAPAEIDAPISITIEAIGVRGAPVVPVGVDPDGDMEIPGRTDVGWYRFGPAPGLPGSAVLAAHIAYDRKPGVFRHLADVVTGDRVEVGFGDESTLVFEVIEKAQYPKGELPIGRVWAKDGEPTLTLITCGGSFNRSIRSYDDNVVVYGKLVQETESGSSSQTSSSPTTSTTLR
jgi:sortase (surface protein transpeptidase)